MHRCPIFHFCKKSASQKLISYSHSEFVGLSAGTVITEETKVPNNRVLLGALLFGCIVSFVVVICDSLPTEGIELSLLNTKSYCPK